MRKILTLCFCLIAFPALLTAQNWEPLGLNVPQLADFAVHNGNFYISAYPNVLKRSTDEGKTWQTLANDMQNVFMLVPADDRLYAVTYNNFDATGLLYYTTDNGESWVLDTAGAQGNFFGPGKAYIKQLHYWNGHLAAIFDNADAYYIRSIATGEWKKDAFLVANDAANFTSFGSTLISSGAGINYTTDFGANWVKPKNAGLPAWWSGSRVFKDGERLYIWGQAYNTKMSLFTSDDMGESWTETKYQNFVRNSFIGVPQTPVAFFAKGDSLWVSVSNDKPNTTPDIMFSANRGETFSLDTLGLSAEPFGTISATRFVENKGYLYAVIAGTDIMRKKISADGTSSIENEMDDLHFKFFPNPASAEISFSAHQDFKGVLVLTDYLGREVLRQTVSGKAEINIAQFGAGMYVLNVFDAEKRIFTEQFIIQR